MFKNLWNNLFKKSKYKVYIIIALNDDFGCEEVITGSYDFEAARHFADAYAVANNKATYVKALHVL